MWDLIFLCAFQQNHEYLMSMYQDMELGTSVPYTTSSYYKERKKEEKQIIDNLLSHFSTSRQAQSKTKARYPAVSGKFGSYLC